MMQGWINSFGTILAAGAALVLVSCSPVSSSSNKDVPTKPLRVLSYNAYLLEADPNGGSSVAQRLLKLPDSLAATNADVIIMQEVWGTKNRAQLAEAMAARGYAGQAREVPSIWPPYHYGNGLYIFVKAPLAFVGLPKMTAYNASTALNFDGFTTKGIIVSKVNVPGVGVISVAAAHTGYLPFNKETHTFDMTQEAKLMAQVKTVTTEVSAADTGIKILGIDNNTPPQVWDGTTLSYDMNRQSNVYAAFLAVGLTDAMATAAVNTCLPGCSTWDNDRNAFIKMGLFGGAAGVTTDPNERIDYVFFSGEGVSATTAGLTLDGEHEFSLGTGAETVTKKLPLSDHFGVLTELALPTL